MRNNINTYADLTAYNSDTNKDYPNVSYLVDEDEVKWVKDDPLLVVIYNVTSTSSATELIKSSYYKCIDKQYIDGIEQQTVRTSYIFRTLGEHTVKYRLTQNYLYKSIFFNLQNIKEVQIPNNVTTIQENCFASCGNLTKIKLPVNLTTVEKNIFANSSNLTDVKLPKTLTSISDQMFRQTAITNIIIPESVTSIGYYAFINCSGLTSVTVEATTPPTLGTNVFQGTTCPIYVPSQSVESYKTTGNWVTYADRIFAIS